MRRALVEAMTCPYCLGRFAVPRASGRQTDRIDWGLLRCRCFEFPIVDGVLLLSLAKGYGGSEEALAPYVPLQVAAIRYIGNDDVDGLRGWIGRQIPLLDRLMATAPVDYVSFSTDLNRRLWPQVETDLYAWSRYEVLGRRGAGRRGIVGALAGNPLGLALFKAYRRLFPPVWSTFYMMRFISTELAELRTRLQDIPIDGPVLSLCCGHGPFELLLRGRAPQVPTVSMDGQIINLFTVKRFIAPDADYICHDAQFSLPFADGHFSHVFSSSCLGEIPTQAHFVREARRVTADDGWTMFDGVTPEEGARVMPTRYYRACQNPFASHRDYFSLMLECAAGRSVAVTPTKPATPSWRSSADDLDAVPTATFMLTGAADGSVTPARPAAFSAQERALLAVNPLYDVSTEGAALQGRLRRRKAATRDLPAQISIETARLDDEAYVARLYQSGAAVLLPAQFGPDVVRLFAA